MLRVWQVLIRVPCCAACPVVPPVVGSSHGRPWGTGPVLCKSVLSSHMQCSAFHDVHHLERFCGRCLQGWQICCVIASAWQHPLPTPICRSHTFKNLTKCHAQLARCPASLALQLQLSLLLCCPWERAGCASDAARPPAHPMRKREGRPCQYVVYLLLTAGAKACRWRRQSMQTWPQEDMLRWAARTAEAQAAMPSAVCRARTSKCLS